MIAVVFDITFTGDPFSKRERDKAIKLALRFMLRKWFTDIFDRHFGRQAFRHYRGVYERRKSKRGKRRGPNLDTGRMRRELKTSFRVKNKSFGVVGEMKGPVYTDIRRGPDKALELTFVSKTEERALARVFRDHLVLQANTSKATRRIRVRSAI